MPPFGVFQVKRTLGQFTPARWDKDEWHPFLGPFRFLQVLSLCIIFLTVELNTFFLKFCLWVPPRNPIIVYRLVLWWLIAIPTIREYNSYLQDRYLASSMFLPKIKRFDISKVLILAFILQRCQKTGEKSRNVLLVIRRYLHCGTSHLHQVWIWYGFLFHGLIRGSYFLL